jgi:hypothetical protein
MCDATNCPNGCCSANGQCITYAQQELSVCGRGGDACAVCPGDAVDCTQGTCVIDQPCLDVCEDGCCTAEGQCIAFGDQDDATCGGAGSGSQQCMGCAGTLSCVTGACVADSVWRVSVISAVIAPTKNGVEWDTTIFTNPLPDAHAGLALQGDLFIDGFTPTIDNTLTPNWNHAIGNYLESDLLTVGVRLNIRDADGVGIFETIGSCGALIPTAALTSGTITIASCGFASNVVLRLVKQ